MLPHLPSIKEEEEEEEDNVPTLCASVPLSQHHSSPRHPRSSSVSAWAPIPPLGKSTGNQSNDDEVTSSPAKKMLRRHSSGMSDVSVNGPLGPVADSPTMQTYYEPEVFTSSDEDEDGVTIQGGVDPLHDAGKDMPYSAILAELKKLFPLYYTILTIAGILCRPGASRFETVFSSSVSFLVVLFSSLVCTKVVFDLLGPIACASTAAIAAMNIGVHLFLASTLQRPSYVLVYICDSARMFGRKSKVSGCLRKVNIAIATFSASLTACGLVLIWRGAYTPYIRLFLWIGVGISTPFLGLSIAAFASLHVLVCLLFRIELRHYTMKVFSSAVSPNAAFAWGRMLRSNMGAFSKSFGLVLATLSAILILASFPLLISSISHWRAIQDAKDTDRIVKAVVASSLFLLSNLFILVFFAPPAILHASCLDHINKLNLAYASFDFEAHSPSSHPRRKQHAIPVRTSHSFRLLTTAKLVTAWTPLQFGHFVNFNKNCDFGYQILGQTMTMASSVNVIYALVSIQVVIATMAMRYDPSF